MEHEDRRQFFVLATFTGVLKDNAMDLVLRHVSSSTDFVWTPEVALIQEYLREHGVPVRL